MAPDGKTLYTANGLTDDVSIVDVAAGKETGRIHVGSKPWGVVFVP
jgi:YVTN family beta-propeller protein